MSSDQIKIPLRGGQDYLVPEADLRIWQKEYPAVDVIQELKKMAQWSRANPPRRKTRRGIQRFIVNWLNGEASRKPRQPVAHAASHKLFEPEAPKKITKEVGKAGLAALKEAMKR